MPDVTDSVIKMTIPGLPDLCFSELMGWDEISRPFCYEVIFSSRATDVQATKHLGKTALITVGDRQPRSFGGYIVAFGLHEVRGEASYYRMTLAPWLWFLSMKTDNRIFQNKTVPQILEEVFSEYPSAKFVSQLKATYKPRDYCVQYGETDLDFVQRLMEHEGIFYFFDHASQPPVMVLVDQNATLKPGLSTGPLAYEPDVRLSFFDGDFITDWTPVSVVTPGAFTQTDYDFTKPSSNLMAKSENPAGYKGDKGENYRYPGYYVDLSRGDKLAAIRLEALQAPMTTAVARGTVRLLWSGLTFKLKQFPVEPENTDYMVLRADYHVWSDLSWYTTPPRLGIDGRERDRRDKDGSEGPYGEGYQVSLKVQPTATPYRPPLVTPHPVMRGPQTAVVVGPAGSEIFTDEYSRVKVQFHWDRKGKKDQNTTCFIRVSSAWAGAGWGFIQIPRIGQEVIVDFLDGDPDQPIITGRVYNAEQMPPYGLPGNATQSGWKSNSSPGGGGWNEIRFEDKKGAEEVYFQAEKDHNELVKNNESRRIGNDFAEDVGHDAQQSIGNDRTESVGHDKAVSVGNNRTVSIGVNDDETVGSNRSLTVGSNETISIGSNSTETIGIAHTQTVGAVQTITIGAARVDSVAASETRSVGGPQTNTIGAARSVTVGAAQSHSVGADDSVQIAGSQGTQIGGDQSISVSGGLTLSVGKDNGNSVSGGRKSTVGKDELLEVGGKMGISVGQTLTIEVKDEITLKCGSAQIVMKKDGTIAIEGKDITVKGSGKINLKADSDINAKGSKINLN